MGNKGSFSLVAIVDSDIVVFPLYVKLSEDFCILQLIDEVRAQGKRIDIMDNMFI